MTYSAIGAIGARKNGRHHGRAGDLLGRRRMFVVGLLLFSAASLAGGLATSPAWLLAARAVQGAGAAIVAPTALALIATTFPPGPPRNRAMGVYAAMSVAGAAAGLIAGGLLVTYASWRWVLFVNVPVGIAVALAAPAVLPGTARRTGRFDLPGTMTGTVGVAALVYGLSNAATSPGLPGRRRDRRAHPRGHDHHDPAPPRRPSRPLAPPTPGAY